ncbi:RSP_2647 family RNA methyltransferase [Litoreibacter arenae]|uniref:LSU m5C1962 methyltransferase RlmI n=1 Tax=Litoreibacter arenae DSM 19593 TaxID=1123360 RepID=S9QIJ8_9RHOB|nr:class I SAM-dependent rRNA methyltransferase [Litoreibacter arenae]EPX81296.1 LSU m5C1962 methyltransferase RlmI [Litoreibacter arenae DSM 19593]
MTSSPFSASPYPVIRLKPKANAQTIRGGAPWVYADELVTDRRTRRLEPGSLAVLEDSDRDSIAVVTINAESKIICRVMDRDPAAELDQNWLLVRVHRALALREDLYDAPFYRLIHAEADGLPGVIVDRFGDVLVMQPNAAWAEKASEALAAALSEVTGATTVIKNAAGRARGLEGLDDVSTTLIGGHEGLIEVPMNGATYMADVEGGQKTGMFFDQRDNHAWAAKLHKGGRVLDVFSHVGGFSLAALAAGASYALAVDSSEPALALAEKGAEASGVADRFETRKGEAFKVMEALAAEGELFDLVVADPPAFAPNKQALSNGLTAYSRVGSMAAKLVKPGGYLVLCSCSHAADLTKFRQASLRGVGRAGREAQIIHTGAAGADHPLHPALAESGYLKAIFLRLD